MDGCAPPVPGACGRLPLFKRSFLIIRSVEDGKSDCFHCIRYLVFDFNFYNQNYSYCKRKKTTIDSIISTFSSQMDMPASVEKQGHLCAGLQHLHRKDTETFLKTFCKVRSVIKTCLQ